MAVFRINHIRYRKMFLPDRYMILTPQSASQRIAILLVLLGSCVLIRVLLMHLPETNSAQLVPAPRDFKYKAACFGLVLD